MAAIETKSATDDLNTSEISFDSQKVPHLTQMSTLLQSFRTNDSLCDITIIVRNCEYKAHKVILASSSGFFRTMFTSGFSEASKTKVVLEETPDLDGERFASLLDFMYTGELKLSLDKVPEILSSAGYLQITTAIQACGDYLNRAYVENRLTLELCLKLSSMTSCGDIDRVTAAANRYLAGKFSEFCQGESFLKHVTFQNMCKLLERNDLKVANEAEVLDALISWLKYDWDNRKTYTSNLLGRVRLGVVPREKIIDAFENKLAVFENQLPECRTLFMDMVKFYSVGKKSFISTALIDKQELIFSPRCESSEVESSNKVLVAIGIRSYCFKDDRKELSEITLSTSRGSVYSHRGHAVTVVNNELYCAGGYNLPGSNAGSVLKYEVKDKKWIGLQQMNCYYRSNFGFIYLNGYLYAVGGTKQDGSPTDTAERYNISSNKWQRLRCLPYVLSTVPSVAIYKHCLIVAGCAGGVRLVIMFNTKTNTWHILHNVYLGNGVDEDVHIYISDDIAYLIVFGTITSKHSTSLQWTTCPNVYKCQLSVEPSDSTFTLGVKLSQKFVPETNMKAFRIGKNVYIILRGYVYKTRVKIDDDQVYDADLSSYSSLESVNNESHAMTCIDRKHSERVCVTTYYPI